MTIQWDDDLLTGVDEVDNQHKEIFIRVNRLIDACDKGKGREEIKSTFNFLKNYIVIHFKSEEILMYRSFYPYLYSHIDKHKKFVAAISQLRQDIEKYGVSDQFINNARNSAVEWLINHICEEDKDLARFVRDKYWYLKQ